MNTIVRPVSRSRLISATVARASAGRRPAITSSSSRTVGRVASARAISSRFSSISVRSSASSSARPSRPTSPSASSARCSASLRPTPGLPNIAPTRTFSRTVISGKGCTTWKARPSPRWQRSAVARPLRSRPSSATVPAVGASRPEIRLSSVDLPAPFGPMMAKISPRATSKETSSTAARPPKRLASEDVLRMLALIGRLRASRWGTRGPRGRRSSRGAGPRRACATRFRWCRPRRAA